METLKPRFQERDGWCGPACLQFIAREHGIPTTQSELARIMHTSHEGGTGHYEMFCGAMEIGLQPTQTLGMMVETLAELLPNYYVVVDWMTGTNESDDGHYDLLHKVENEKVYLNDATMTIEEFNSKWYDIESDGKRVDKWAMIVGKRK